MKTNVKPQIVALWKFVACPMAVCLLGVALLGAAAVGFAQTPGPSLSPGFSPDGQTQINNNATDLTETETATKLSADELASLVGPIALYPDPLLFQVLAASTYPLEIVQLKQWLDQNKNLKGKEQADAVAQQNWDPSVQALAAFPAVVDKLANKIRWTTDLGNAFLAQQNDVMDSVQNLRTTAQTNGALNSNDKQTVGTETTNDGKQAITIESAQRDVVYVPSYNTQYVYRNSGYSDDSSYSNYSGFSGYSGYSSGSDGDYSYLAYATGAATGYYWGRYNWRDRYGYANRDNYYVKNYNNSNSAFRNNANNISQRLNEGSGKWQHDPTHRGNTPYGNRDLTNRFGQANNRLVGGAGNRASQAPGANAANQLARGNQPSQLARANPGNQLARGNLSRPPGTARPSTRPPNGDAPNRVGNRIPSNWPSTARGGAFGPANGDFARAFSARGAQSMGPPSGFRGGAPMGGGFRGGPPGGGPPMGGGLPPGGPPMGGAPPPPPPPPPP